MVGLGQKAGLGTIIKVTPLVKQKAKNRARVCKLGQLWMCKEKLYNLFAWYGEQHRFQMAANKVCFNIREIKSKNQQTIKPARKQPKSYPTNWPVRPALRALPGCQSNPGITYMDYVITWDLFGARYPGIKLPRSRLSLLEATSKSGLS